MKISKINNITKCLSECRCYIKTVVDDTLYSDNDHAIIDLLNNIEQNLKDLNKE